MRKLLSMIWKDIYISYTDRMALVFMFAAPFGISLIIGLAFGNMGSNDIAVEHISVLMVNQDQGVELPTGDTLNLGDQMTEFFIAPPSPTLEQFLAAREVKDEAQARHMIESGEAVAMILIPEDFSAQTNSQADSTGQSTVLLYYSRFAPVSYRVVESILTEWLNRVSTGTITANVGIAALSERLEGLQVPVAIGNLTNALLEGEAYTATPITIREESAEGKKRDFDLISVIAPSMAIFFLTFNVTMGAGELLTEQKQGTLQRMIASPTPRAMILAGKMAAVYLIGVSQLVILLVATSVLGANWGSNVLPIAMLVMTAVFAAVGLGALIASLVKEPQQLGTYGTGILMVMGVLSGSFTQTNFLGNAKFLSQMTLNWWGIEGFAALAGGGGLSAIAPHLLVLTLMGTVYFAIGVWRFSRRLEF